MGPQMADESLSHGLSNHLCLLVGGHNGVALVVDRDLFGRYRCVAVVLHGEDRCPRDSKGGGPPVMGVDHPHDIGSGLVDLGVQGPFSRELAHVLPVQLVALQVRQQDIFDGRGIHAHRNGAVALDEDAVGAGDAGTGMAQVGGEPGVVQDAVGQGDGLSELLNLLLVHARLLPTNFEP